MSIVSRMDGPMHIVDDPEIKGKNVTVPGTEPPQQVAKQQKNLAQTVLGAVPESVKSTVSGITKPADTVQDGPEPQMHSYDDVINYLQDRMAAIHIPTKEELEKERRRQRTERIISSASDAGRALANLFATSEYAPNAYEGNVMTERMQQRFDRLKAEREADADRYYNYAMTLGRIKDARDQQAYQRGRDKVADAYRAAAEKRAQEQADFERSLDPYKLQEQIGDTAKAGYEADKAKTEAEYEPKHQEANLRLTNAKTKTEGSKQRSLAASAQSSLASAANSYAQAANAKGQFSVYSTDPDTGERVYMSGFKGEKEAKNYAASHPGWYYETIPEVSATAEPDDWRKIKTKVTVKSSSKAHQNTGTMPGVSNKGNKGTMPGVK